MTTERRCEDCGRALTETEDRYCFDCGGYGWPSGDTPDAWDDDDGATEEEVA
jgi:hypothetical protein